MRRGILILILVPCLAVAVACSGKEEPRIEMTDADLTVEGIYTRFAEAIDRPDLVYKVTVEMNTKSDLYSLKATERRWVDVRQEMIRGEYEGDLRSDEDGGSEEIHYKDLNLIVDGREYRHTEEPEREDNDMKLGARTCFGAGSAVSAVLGCPGSTEESTKTLELGEYRGRKVVILVTSGTRHGSDETDTFTERLYLDRRTLLPIAMEMDYERDSGEITHGTGLLTFKNDFVAAESLPDDFFDPASIGYVEKDPEAPLNSDLSVTVYWLGRDFAGSGSLPPLTLRNVTIPQYGGSEYKAALDYRLGTEEFGYPVLTIEEWPAANWGNIGGLSDPCGEQRELDFPAGHATIFFRFDGDTKSKQPTTADGQHACPLSPYNDFLAVAYVGSTVVFVHAPTTIGSEKERVANPYDTLEGMEAVVRALQPRQ